MTSLDQVREFHYTFGMHIARYPGDISESRKELRKKLIEEEYLELIEAVENGHPLSKIAKELADLKYVVEGFAIEYGIPLDDVFDAVHASNMSKVFPDGTVRFREDGKVLKGPDYAEPDLEWLDDKTLNVV